MYVCVCELLFFFFLLIGKVITSKKCTVYNISFIVSPLLFYCECVLHNKEKYNNNKYMGCV